MKFHGVMTTALFSMALSVVGCGEAANPSDATDIPSEVASRLMSEPTEMGDGEMGTLSAMTLATFQSLAAGSDAAGRCVSGNTVSYCNGELDYAYNIGLITLEAYNWGRANGYYPVIDRNNVIQAVCKCGCFESNTLILTEGADGSPVWLKAKDIMTDMSLFSLDEASALSQPVMSMKPIKARTHGEEGPALYVFKLDNGRKLKVTQNHGMLLSDGRVVEARTLDVGAEFVDLEGKIVRVVDLDFKFTKGEVYNFEVDAADDSGHIIAAEGVLVGDLAWQNQLSKEIGSIVVRK